MKTVIDAPSLVAPPHRSPVVAIYATTAAAATIKQYLTVAREAAWGLGFASGMEALIKTSSQR